MVAESGAVLLDDAARAALVERLLPRATVITPNLPEARVLGGEGAPDDPEALARALHELGPEVVVVTGGHRDEAVDVLFDGERTHRIPGERHPDGAAHGSGCTHSSILAAHLALGVRPADRGARRPGARGGGGPGRPARARRRTRPRARPRRCPDGRARLSRSPGAWGIIAAMKFLRMRPGYGEQVIAEGDPEVAADEQRLIEEFRRQLDLGHVGRGAHRASRRPARGGDGAGVRRDPRGTGRVIFFPRAAGGAR